MHPIISIFTLCYIAISCQSPGPVPGSENDTLARYVLNKYPAVVTRPDTGKKNQQPVPYNGLAYESKELLAAAPGTKSVVFNAAGTKIYAMNLEGMSVYEFDRASRKITREFKFTPTRGTGWDYDHSRPIASFQEKPVEACLSHNDEILWVSLHNAEGIIPIWLNDYSKNIKSADKDQPQKPVTVIYPGKSEKDSFYVPLIKTGKTPKVLARTQDSRYLLVSNWHSHNTSVLELDKERYPYGKVISTVAASAIPRGIVVDDKHKKSYVAIMGGSTLAVIDNNSWEGAGTLSVASNPRHVVMDTSGHLFVSFNKLATVACLDAETGKTLFTAKTHAQPRTIILSKNYKFLFVTCYNGDYLDVYKINDDNFEKVASLPCSGHPVGVDIFENDTRLEAWVCSYSNGRINIYSFKKTGTP